MSCSTNCKLLRLISSTRHQQRSAISNGFGNDISFANSNNVRSNYTKNFSSLSTSSSVPLVVGHGLRNDTPLAGVRNAATLLVAESQSKSNDGQWGSWDYSGQGNGGSKSSSRNYMMYGGCIALGALLATDINNRSVVSAAPNQQLSVALLLQQADDHYSLAEYQQIYNLLVTHKDSKNDEVLWRLCRATYKCALVEKSTTERTALLKEAFSYVQEALSINENNYAVHKWMAILVDEVAATDGSKARILQSFVMKQHMERACELKPKDGTSWYLLGMWHYNIADIPWYTRKAAAVLFASPPQSTFEEALKVFLHAEQVEPNFYSQNLVMIGKCYKQMKNRDSAVEYLRRARDLVKGVAVETQDDKDAEKQAKELLTALGDK